MIYYEPVTPIIIEENIDLIELKKDGHEIIEYKNGKKINENGKYTLKVRDKANNTIVINFTINLLSLDRVIIAKNPNKTEYIEGQNFDKTGMIVKAIYDNGEQKEISDYTITPNERLKTTDNKIVISYTENGVTRTIKREITVRGKQLTEIKIEKVADKLEYIEGQNFDKTGMVIKAIYDNGEQKEISNYTITPDEALKITDSKIVISYTENGVTRTKGQAITVKARKIEKLIIKTRDYEEKIGENTKYIKGIKPQTTLESFKNNIETNGRIKVKKEETEITDNRAKIGTGMKIEITLKDEKVEYMLVVIGDCNGSGTTNVADLTKLMMSRAESLADNKDESKILNGAYAEAADLNNDGKISVADITKLCMYIAENK